jgi:transposase/biotin operon repressor
MTSLTINVPAHERTFSAPCSILLDQSNSTNNHNLVLLSNRKFELPPPGPKKLIFPCPDSDFNQAFEEAYNFLKPKAKVIKRKRTMKEKTLNNKSKQLIKVAEMLDNGYINYAEIGRTLGISRQLVKYNAKRIRKYSKGIEDKRKNKKKLKQEHEHFLEKYLSIQENQTNTLKDILIALTQYFSLPSNYISLKTLSVTLKKLKISRKRVIKVDPEKNSQDTIQQRKLVARMLVESYRRKHNMFYIDEVAFAPNLRPNYGYSKKGIKIKVTGRLREKNYSVIAAMNSEKIIAWSIFDGSIKSIDFLGFISQLASKLRDEFNVISPVLFFDNAPTHRSKIVQAGLSHHFALMFNAKYTPELNPIELAFNKVKSYFRRNAKNSSANFLENICESFRSITCDDVKGFMDMHLRQIRDAYTKDLF